MALSLSSLVVLFIVYSKFTSTTAPHAMSCKHWFCTPVWNSTTLITHAQQLFNSSHAVYSHCPFATCSRAKRYTCIGMSCLHDWGLKLPDSRVKGASLGTQVLSDTQYLIAARLLSIWDHYRPQCTVALRRKRLPHAHRTPAVLTPNEVKLPSKLDWRAIAVFTVIAVHL